MGEIEFQVGDIVTRDGTDRQKVIAVDGDLIEVKCVKEPLGWLQEDGTRDPPWCRVGDRERNLTRRYSYPEDTIIEGQGSGSKSMTDIETMRAMLNKSGIRFTEDSSYKSGSITLSVETDAGLVIVLWFSADGSLKSIDATA